MIGLFAGPAAAILGWRRALRDRSGSVAILFALSATALVMAAGAGIDLARTYTARQKLSEIATLACQYASRPSVVQTIAPTYTGPNGGQIYASAVQTYIASALVSQQFGYPQTNGAPFTYRVNGPADVSLAAAVPTTLMRILRIEQLAVGVTSHCYDNSATIPQTVPDPPGQMVISEGFEASPCSGRCVSYLATNGQGPTSPPWGNVSNSFNSAPAYTGLDGRGWNAMGGCVEIDSTGITTSTTPEGSHSLELDCTGNSSISTKSYLPAGSYELRYFYVARVPYPDYSPAFICGSTAADVSWANSRRALPGLSAGGVSPTAFRTNQVNVYLDPDQNGQPPTHTTLDGTQTLAGRSLVDVCVYAAEWIERSVRIEIATPGFYWLSLASDGDSDSFGGQIDSVRLCQKICPGTLQDNFPTAWRPAAGVAKELFRDGFDTPAYSNDGSCDPRCTTAGNLNRSLGTTGTPQSGWPGQPASGWATSPYNQMDLWLIGGTSGAQFLELDGSASGPRNLPTSNRTISRPFLLDPGYYQVGYSYRSDAWMAGMTDPQCTAAPAGPADLAPYGAGGSATATNLGGYWGTVARDTNTVGAFVASDQLTSIPIGGGVLDSRTSWLNPDGSTTTSPLSSPTALDYATYAPAQPSPLLDICRYASAWQARSVAIRIQKPGSYWLHVAALGASDNIGGAIDDVRVTALGSLAMPSPPAPAVTIPVAGPQPGSLLTFPGFSIVANPLNPPAPLP